MSQSEPSPAPWIKRPNPIQIGLTAIKPEHWLATPEATILSQRKRLLETQTQAVFAAEEQSHKACVEAAIILRRHTKTPLKHQQDDTHPLLSLGGEIMEDCLILQQDKDQDMAEMQWRLTAGVLCFPAHWHLDEKMGQPMATIHRPVPHYAEKLNRPVDKLFNHMERGKFTRRKNWTLQIGDKRHAPKRQSSGTDNQMPAVEPEQVGHSIFCREEIQSFVKLPETGAILFTIQTHLSPLSRWQHDPHALSFLLNELAALSPAMRHYRAVETYEKALIEWVHQQTASDSKSE